MYTIDDQNSDEFEEYVENNFWSNNKGLIIKIIIIILCIIVLIWLFKALRIKQNKNIDNSIHIANIEKVRIAAEDYFFVKNNKSDTSIKVVNLQVLKEQNLLQDITDTNNKVCNNNSSTVSLTPQNDSYKMNIKLFCSLDEKEEDFYYNYKTLACLNCTGNTLMTGQKQDSDNEKDNGGDKNDDNTIPINNSEFSEYSCVKWSDWKKERSNDSLLQERSKTLVQGVKYGTSETKTVYGEWSEYTKTPITNRDDIEVETKVVYETKWSEPKKSQNIDSNNQNIKIIDKEMVNSSISCQNNDELDNKCYSDNMVVGNLTFKEYHSGKYKIYNNTCEGVKTLKNSDGKYVLTYVNCQYSEIGNSEFNYSTYPIYTYQELETVNVTYYRYRTITEETLTTENIYTKEKYEEKDLPDGYVKLIGSEEVYYSYKLATCEK